MHLSCELITTMLYVVDDVPWRSMSNPPLQFTSYSSLIALLAFFAFIAFARGPLANALIEILSNTINVSGTVYSSNQLQILY